MSDDEQHTSTVIVALPADTDAVQDIGPEQKHATLVFLGDLSAADSAVTVEDVLDGVTRWLADPMAGGELTEFTATVTGVQSLGDEGARVWMLDGATGLQVMHDAVLSVADVKTAYDQVDQFPTYTPHVTIGYPPAADGLEPTAAADDVTNDLGPLDEATETAAADVESITFDRIAVWAGPDQHVFQLSPPAEGGAAVPETKSRKPRARRDLEPQREYRLLRPSIPLEQRASGVMSADGEAELIEIVGQVIVYGVAYEVWDPWGCFEETIHYGSCTALLANTAALDCRFLYNHNADHVMARTGTDTLLELTDSPEALNIRALVDPRITVASDLILRLQHKLITQMSVGMIVDPKGDVWSGEDEWGLPNVRDIYSLVEVPDVSAVTYPASPTTTIQLAERAWAGVPIASRARTRQLWELAREGRAGRISQHDSDILMHVIERLHTVDAGITVRAQFEPRGDATAQDALVTVALQAAQAALTHAIEEQAADPDNATDPADQAVWDHLTDALTSLNQALAAQDEDTEVDDQEELEEEEGGDDVDISDPDGTSSGTGGNAPVPDNEDGTRSLEPDSHAELIQRQIDVDRDRLRLARGRR